MMHENLMRPCELRLAAKKIETPGFELSPAVVGEFGDQAFLAGDNFSGVETRRAAREAKLPGSIEHTKPPGGFEQRLARHASAQDAKPAHFPPAFDHDGFQSQIDRRSRSRVARTSAADHCKIVFHSII